MTEIKEITERLNTKSMWMFFTDLLHKEINQLKTEIASNTNIRNSNRNKIIADQDFIKLTTGFDLETILSIPSKEAVESLVFKQLDIFPDGETKRKYIILTLVKLIEVNKVLIQKTNYFKKLKQRDIEYAKFCFVLREFNLRIVDKIIEGYTLNLGYNIGEIRIKKKKRIRANVNWPESNRYKNTLIERGLTPYDKEHARHGTKWLIYFTDDVTFWVYWSKVKCKIKNKLYYSFIPVRGDNSVPAKLHSYIKNNPMATLLYN